MNLNAIGSNNYETTQEVMKFLPKHVHHLPYISENVYNSDYHTSNVPYYAPHHDHYHYTDTPHNTYYSSYAISGRSDSHEHYFTETVSYPGPTLNYTGTVQILVDDADNSAGFMDGDIVPLVTNYSGGSLSIDLGYWGPILDLAYGPIDGGSWELIVDPGSGSVSMQFSAPISAPEPSTAILLTSLLALAHRYGRKKRSDHPT